MKLALSLLAWAILLGLLYVAGLVIAADGWLAGGVFLVVAVLLLGLFGTLCSALTGLFRRPPGG